MGLVAGVSLLWLIVKTGRKPSRIAYPCQRAALASIDIFLLALFAPLLDLGKFKVKLPDILNSRMLKTALLTGSLLLTFAFVTRPVNLPQFAIDYVPVPLDLEEQNALALTGTSDLFFVDGATGYRGNMDTALSTLLSLIESHGLYFFKTAAKPAGLIGRRDVVLIKVNAMGPWRSATNTDLIKSLISRILRHPEGFAGEIVVADNGQLSGGLNLAESNAYDHSQSMQDVVNTFSSYKVSAWHWYDVRSRAVREYAEGDLNSGFVINATENPTTHVQVSYPKFKTKYGTYISFKKGIWSTTSHAYDSTRLKIINLPILKSHYDYGVTACVKNYMGVTAQFHENYGGITNLHDRIRYGALGTEIAETRFPTLNLLDAIWVNANPIESGSKCGPFTHYEDASFTNTLGASRDPVALEYWAAKHILIPAAIRKGYTTYSSLSPDYTPITPGLTESYHNYLEKTMNELKRAGYQATMTESAMNVYVAHTRIFEDGFESGSFSKWTGLSKTYGETTSVVNVRRHHGTYSARFTSNGGGGTEYASCYKTISTMTELYARGYFYVSQSGIVENGDLFHLISFKASLFSGMDVAAADWKKVNGVVKWSLSIRYGTGTWATAYSSTTPAINRWYCVELHWRMGTTTGMGELFVNGARVCIITGKNTASLGGTNQVSFGLPGLLNCGRTTVYCDCTKMKDTYIGIEA